MQPQRVYLEIRLLSQHGLSLRQIASEAGCTVNKVGLYSVLKVLPKYER